MSDSGEVKIVPVKVVEYSASSPVDLGCLEKRFRGDKQVFLTMLR